MIEQPPKEMVLKRIRRALQQKTTAPEPHVDWEKEIYTWDDGDLAVRFVQEFTAIAGKFLFCESRYELAESLKALAEQQGWEQLYCFEPELKALLRHHEVPFREGSTMLDADAAVTSCEALVARFGSIVVSSRQAMGRQATVYPPVHIVVAELSQLAPDLRTAFHLIRERATEQGKPLPSMLSVVSGPSRTADIEKTLVMGAHGPKELYVLMLAD